MSDPIATPEDLAIYLDIESGEINVDRATWLLARAQEKCEQILSPLPAEAIGVVCDIAGRAYRAPAVPIADAPGAHYPSGTATGSLFLTSANIAELQRLSPSGSGAFTIDPTPTDAGAGNFWPQIPLTPEGAGSGQWLSDWDRPPT